MEKYEIKDGNKIVTVEVLEIEGKEFYTIAPEYFENEILAEGDGYFWNDEISKWTKEIIDNTTIVF